jgi:hypothetical protein
MAGLPEANCTRCTNDIRLHVGQLQGDESILLIEGWYTSASELRKMLARYTAIHVYGRAKRNALEKGHQGWSKDGEQFTDRPTSDFD